MIIMTKISTGSTLPSTVTRKRSRYIINSLLMVVLLVLTVLYILVWPVRMLTRGIKAAAKWTLSQYR